MKILLILKQNMALYSLESAKRATETVGRTAKQAQDKQIMGYL